MLELPDVYANVLRWRSEGLPDISIARLLDVLPATVPVLVRVAEAKLIALLANGD